MLDFLYKPGKGYIGFVVKKNYNLFVVIEWKLALKINSDEDINSRGQLILISGNNTNWWENWRSKGRDRKKYRNMLINNFGLGQMSNFYKTWLLQGWL